MAIDLEQKHAQLIDQLEALNAKLDKFLNGSASEQITTTDGRVLQTLSGIIQGLTTNIYVLKVKNHKLLSEANMDNTVMNSDLVRVWGDTSLVNGYYKKIEGSLVKTSLVEIII